MSKRFLLNTTALTPLAILLGTGVALAGGAVSQPNATLGGFGGVWDGSGIGGAQGSWTVPVTPMTGAQLDGILGTANGEFWGQLNGHYFWREPSSGLLGIYAAATQRNGTSDFRIGPEAELYGSQFTLSAVAGVKSGGGGDNFFAQARGSLYLEENTKLYVSYQHDNGDFVGGGFEHLFAGTNLSAFAEARTGAGASGVWGGIRVYFGSPGKSLVHRDREDIAPLWMNVTDKPSSASSTSTSTSTSTTTSTSPTTTLG